MSGEDENADFEDDPKGAFFDGSRLVSQRQEKSVALRSHSSTWHSIAAAQCFRMTPVSNQTSSLLRPGNIGSIVFFFKEVMDGRSMDTEIVEMICEAIKDLAFLMSQADNARNSDEGIEAIEIVVERFVQQVRTLLPDHH
ncbi:hypothetical protein B9Z55_001738 [Caenorhabditis nigoni]|uniref:Uncharacterized protein n=1 Tax=Caenorhabditis nigoni TaxID=1611254 RepID=A0A2G5VH51_9PELO|nr:hypothetical protein B9Z55_001738 [Caenorhabditis nigoni]